MKEQSVFEEEYIQKETDMLHVQDDEKPNKVKDLLYVCFFIFLIQGVGLLFPWNAFVSAPDYFIKLNINSMIYMSVSFTIPNLLGLIVMTLYGQRISLLVQVLTPYSIQVVVLVLLPTLLLVNVMEHRIGLYILVLMCVVTGFTASVVMGGISGFAAMLPPVYFTALMSGQGVAGIIASGLRLITRASIERSPTDHVDALFYEQKISVTIFFFVAACIIVICIFSYLLLLRMPFVQYHIKRCTIPDKTENAYIDDDGADGIEDEVEEDTPKANPFKVFRKIWIYAVSVWFCYLVTIAIFPGLVSKVKSQYPKDSFMASWYLNLLVFDFNFFDLIGRSLPLITNLIRFPMPWTKGKKQSIDQYIFPLSPLLMLLRLVFLPVFIIASLNQDWFQFDWLIYSTMAFMGMTNGYLTSVIMSNTPALVNPEEMMTVGTMMTTFLTSGVASGSIVALIANYISSFIPS